MSMNLRNQTSDNAIDAIGSQTEVCERSLSGPVIEALPEKAELEARCSDAKQHRGELRIPPLVTDITKLSTKKTIADGSFSVQGGSRGENYRAETAADLTVNFIEFITGGNR